MIFHIFKNLCKILGWLHLLRLVASQDCCLQFNSTNFIFEFSLAPHFHVDELDQANLILADNCQRLITYSEALSNKKQILSVLTSYNYAFIEGPNVLSSDKLQDLGWPFVSSGWDFRPRYSINEKTSSNVFYGVVSLCYDQANQQDSSALRDSVLRSLSVGWLRINDTGSEIPEKGPLYSKKILWSTDQSKVVP